MLDGQAPNVEVVADGNDDVNDKAAVDANGHAEEAEHEGDLVDAVAEGRGPAEAKSGQQPGAERVDDAPGQGQGQDVCVGELEVDQVGRDDLPDRVGVDDAGKERKRNQVALPDVGLQEQIRQDAGPGAEEGEQADKGVAGAVALCATGLDHIAARLERVVDQNQRALHHPDLGEGELVQEAGEELEDGNAEGRKHGLLPERGSAEVARQDEDDDDGQDALDGPVDDAESQGLGVVLIPGLDVEGQEGCEKESVSLCVVFYFFFTLQERNDSTSRISGSFIHEKSTATVYQLWPMF